MISAVFFQKYIKDENLDIYTDEFLKYQIALILNTNKNCDAVFIEKSLYKFYKDNIINFSKLKKKLDNWFINKYDIYELGGCEQSILSYVKKFKSDFFFLEWESDKQLLARICRYVSEEHFVIGDALPYAFALLKKNNHIDMNVLEAKLFDMLLFYNQYCDCMHYALTNTDDSYNDLPLNLIIKNQQVLDLLFANELYVLSDLKNLYITPLMLIFSLDFQNTLNSFKILNENFENSYKTKIEELFNGLKPKEYEVIEYRAGFFTGQEMTLEEVGEIYGVTRERIRQLEAKGNNRLIENINNYICILINLFIKLSNNNSKFVTVDDLFSFVNNQKVARYILYLYEICDINIKYNKDLNVIYNSDLISLEEICEEVDEKSGLALSIDDYKKMSSFEQAVVNFTHRLYKDVIYLRKGYTSFDLIALTIDELYPDGIRISDEEHYNHVKDVYIQKYGDIDLFPACHSIANAFDRMGYCQIDKGTYKNISSCVKLPQELIDKIINFILLNQPSVFYSTLFEKFKLELTSLGVNNYYYLKGLIDPCLPVDFKTKRNYITVGDDNTSTTDVIINYMKSFNGEFTLNELQNKFLGVKDYTFYNALYSEGDNGLIWLSSKRFIYISKVIITEQTKLEFRNFIDEIFKMVNANVTSSRKIFARLSLVNKDLLSRLKIATDSFSTFSLIKYLFKDEFGFNRPLISLDKDMHVHSETLIINHISTMDTFNSKTIRNYVQKMNIRGLYSYMEFMEDQSDDFVQVNIDTMVKKNKLALSVVNLNEIEKLLELIFTKTNIVDTRKFNGYSMFPKLTYLWNKYLLVGIIRSYFNDKYEIENTSSFYDKTDFLIRRTK